MKFRYTSNLVRPLWGFVDDAKILFQFTDDKLLKADNDYIAAKSGHIMPALDLVYRLLNKEAVEVAKSEFLGRADYLLPIVAEEVLGDNALPLALAALYSVELDIELIADVYQSNKAYHTGADPMERLISRATFDGEVVVGKKYVLVDDVSTMGSTLADCAAFIAKNGGFVVGSIVLANSSRSGYLKARKKDLKIIEERYNETVKELFSIEPSALTYDEAFYLAGFKYVDTLRGRAIKAKHERENRISSKGSSKP